MALTDWHAWHADYGDPGSALSHRRAAVQQRVRQRLDRGPARVLSLCAGDGADVLGVLRAGDDVRGRLVELDPVLAGRARSQAPPGIEVVTGDAGMTDACAGAVPADLLLLCGIFGNIPDEDIRGTIAALPQLCAPGGTIVWTRGRPGPGGPQPGGHPTDRTAEIRAWFAEADCTEVSFEAPHVELWSVGVHRFEGRPTPLVRGRRLFTFDR